MVTAIATEKPAGTVELRIYKPRRFTSTPSAATSS
jgi:hypothetical protein